MREQMLRELRTRRDKAEVFISNLVQDDTLTKKLGKRGEPWDVEKFIRE